MAQDPNLTGAQTRGVRSLAYRSSQGRGMQGKTKPGALASRTVHLVAARLARGFPPTLWAWCVVAVCAVLADTAHAGMSGSRAAKTMRTRLPSAAMKSRLA